MRVETQGWASVIYSRWLRTRRRSQPLTSWENCSRGHWARLRWPSAADIALAAHALSYVVTSNRRFTDLFECGQRSVPLSLAAEIQHRLLPAAYTGEAAQFTLTAWLEPAGNIAGDSFDFSVDPETVHLAMSDAMVGAQGSGWANRPGGQLGACRLFPTL